jgi:hypothetical protein
MSLNEAQQDMILIPIPPDVEGSYGLVPGKQLDSSGVNTSV